MEHRPLVIVAGQVKQLPQNDTVAGVATFLEPVVIRGFNNDLPYITGNAKVPMFVTTREGDVVVAKTAGG